LGLVGPRAQEAVIKREMPRSALLHFATHGLLDSRDGMRSCLLLAPEPEGSGEDGVLEAREIAGMTLSARLAVLSACESGRGQPGGGEGLVGLAWAFRAAGCPSVVASEWSVDDAATERLMEAFYRGVKGKMRLDDALRQAMLSVRAWTAAKEGRDVPYYWAAFQVMGSTSPVAVPASTGAH
jgi:CHAT domain-containing protein